MKDYEPYGKEWEAEIMKLSKLEIIDLYRIVCIKRLEKYVIDQQEAKP